MRRTAANTRRRKLDGGWWTVGDRFTMAPDYRLPTTDYRLPTTDYRLPTTDYRLPTTDYRPITTLTRNVVPPRLVSANVLETPELFCPSALGTLAHSTSPA